MEQQIVVAKGTPVTPRGGPAVPVWVRRAVLRGLRCDPDTRWPSMRGLLDALERRGERRALLVVVAGVSLVLIGLWIAHWVIQTRERDELVAAHLEHAATLLTDARAVALEAEAMRSVAFAAFDRGDLDAGETQFQASIARDRVGLAGYKQTIREYEQAFSLDSMNDRSRSAMLDALYEYAVAVERSGDHKLADEITERLKIYDSTGASYRAWNAPAEVSITTEPAGAAIRVEQYVQRAIDAPLTLDVLPGPGRTPATLALPPGSYRLMLTLADHAPVYFRFVAARGEDLPIAVPLPKQADVPPGFIHIPAGTFLYGYHGSNELRAFFLSQPMHPVSTHAYLIAANETTYADYIGFLESLAPAERLAHLPKSGQSSLRRREDGIWEYTLQIGESRQAAAAGEQVQYPERPQRTSVDWTLLPIGGLTIVQQTDSYLAWLNRSGRVPNARRCTEHEWERAARGADERQYPHGDSLSSVDANFDETYGPRADMYPDPVGSFPQSQSPFGLFDVTGNLWEVVDSAVDPKLRVLRGGAFASERVTARLVNRAVNNLPLIDETVGLRVCASVRANP